MNKYKCITLTAIIEIDKRLFVKCWPSVQGVAKVGKYILMKYIEK